MAHNLEIINGVASFAENGLKETAWHGLGQVFDGEMDVAKRAYPKFQEKLSVCRDLFYGYDYSKFMNGSDLERAKCISGAVNFIVDIKKDAQKEAFLKESYLLKQALSLQTL